MNSRNDLSKQNTNLLNAELEINNKYKKAKSLLKKVNDSFRKESGKTNINSKKVVIESLDAENKAALAIKNNIAPLYEEVIAYYFAENSLLTHLEGIKIAIEFLHKYPVNKEIFDEELKKLHKYLQVCDKIMNISLTHKLEAFASKELINNKLIPNLHYNYAVLSHTKFKINNKELVKNEKDYLLELDEQRADIERLEHCLVFYKNDKSIMGILNKKIAESYNLVNDKAYHFVVKEQPAADNFNILEEKSVSDSQHFEILSSVTDKNIDKSDICQMTDEKQSSALVFQEKITAEKSSTNKNGFSYAKFLQIFYKSREMASEKKSVPAIIIDHDKSPGINCNSSSKDKYPMFLNNMNPMEKQDNKPKEKRKLKIIRNRQVNFPEHNLPLNNSNSSEKQDSDVNKRKNPDNDSDNLPNKRIRW